MTTYQSAAAAAATEASNPSQSPRAYVVIDDRPPPAELTYLTPAGLWRAARADAAVHPTAAAATEALQIHRAAALCANLSIDFSNARVNRLIDGQGFRDAI